MPTNNPSPAPGASAPTAKTPRGAANFLRFHSLSLVTLGILLLWICLYVVSDPNHHAGAFFGNAIADWSGTLVLIIATKYFFEKGSGESRPVPRRFRGFVLKHSLSIFLVVTGLGWFALYANMDSNSKWGQVVGNLTSSWVQALGLVLLTKRLLERGSKESKRC